MKLTKPDKKKLEKIGISLDDLHYVAKQLTEKLGISPNIEVEWSRKPHTVKQKIRDIVNVCELITQEDNLDDDDRIWRVLGLITNGKVKKNLVRKDRKYFSIPTLENADLKKKASRPHEDHEGFIYQKKLIDQILRILLKYEGRVDGYVMRQEFYSHFKEEFQKSWWQERLSNGMIRWVNQLQWLKLKLRVRNIVKIANPQKYGVWEFTKNGEREVEKILNLKKYEENEQ